tara:strand:- start:664 stop:1446 length:783 start_codon:yes stop_codon:yes gene_type:complete
MTTLNNKMNATTEIENATTRTPTTVVSTVLNDDDLNDDPDTCSAPYCEGGRAFEMREQMFCSPACGNKHFNLNRADNEYWCDDNFDDDFDGLMELGAEIAEIEDTITRMDEFYAPKEECGKCCLCKGMMSNNWGNNPAPLRKRGKCCDKCNAEKVVPARMRNIDGVARFGGKSFYNLGTHEEQVLQAKLFLLMGEKKNSWTGDCMWEHNYEPFNKIKRDYRDLVIARGMFPVVNWRERSIAFTVIAEMMKDEWDKQNPVK